MRLSASRWAFSVIWPQAFVISTRGDEIEESADATICRHVQKHGALNSRIDVDLVKDLAVETALSKVFYNYDPERAKKANAQLSTFLNKVVNNCVLNELSSEGRELKKGGLLNGHETALDNSTPGAGKSGNDGRFFEPYTYNTWERGISYRQRHKLNEMVMNKLSMLPESDKILIDCLLYSFSHPVIRIPTTLTCTSKRWVLPMSKGMRLRSGNVGLSTGSRNCLAANGPTITTFMCHCDGPTTMPMTLLTQCLTFPKTACSVTMACASECLQ